MDRTAQRSLRNAVCSMASGVKRDSGKGPANAHALDSRSIVPAGVPRRRMRAGAGLGGGTGAAGFRIESGAASGLVSGFSISGSREFALADARCVQHKGVSGRARPRRAGMRRQEDGHDTF